MKGFTLLEEIRSKQSERFHNGKTICFDIQEENIESILEKVINIYENRKKNFENNKIYVDNCSLFIVNYMLSGIDSNNCLRRFTLSADSYHKEGYVEVRTYRCESHLKITKKTLKQLKTYIEYVNG